MPDPTATNATLEDYREAMSIVRKALESVTTLPPARGSLRDEAQAMADAIADLRQLETETVLPVG